MSVDLISAVSVTVVLVGALLVISRNLSRKRSVAIVIVVSDEMVEISSNGKRLFVEPSVLRYRIRRPVGIPQLVNDAQGAAGDMPGVLEYRFAGQTGDPPGGLIHAFLVGCCIRARALLHVSQLCTLDVLLVPALEDDHCRSTLVRDAQRGDFKSFGIVLVLAPNDRLAL
jgi:hypothetical protein